MGMYGGGGGDQTVTQEWKPPAFIQPYLEANVGGIMDVAQRYAQDMPVYDGQRVAGMAPMQELAAGGLQNYVYGNPWAPHLMSFWNRTFEGKNVTDALRNQYANSPAQRNQYAGDSPEMQNLIAQSNADITRDYKTGTAAQLDSAAARSGAFGGSAYEEMTANNERALGDALARNTSNLRDANFQRSQQLEEGYLGRQADATRMLQGLEESYLGRLNQNSESAYDRAYQVASMFPQINQSTLSNFAALMGAGDLQRQIEQQQLEGQHQQWYDEAFAPLQGNEILMNFLRGMGGLGGTQTGVTSGPSMSPWGSLAGGGLLAASLMGR